MADAFTIAVQSMQNDLDRMDIISQNVVNSATPGYRRALPTNQTFVDVLQSSSLSGNTANVEVALPTVTAILDPTAGSKKQTGQPLDLAINGDGYFELTTPEGVAYTRAGNFHIDQSGRLVNQDGYAVNGDNGDIIVNGKSTATVSANGDVSDGDNTIGRLRIARFDDKHALEMGPRGLLVTKNKDVQSSASSAQIQSGYLENSNVMPLDEMIHMMETSRHFESQQKLFQGYDEQISAAIQRLGQF